MDVRGDKDITGKSFYPALEHSLGARGLSLEKLCAPDDAVARRVLEEYGAMFMVGSRVRVPPVCIFSSEAEVAEFQREAGFARYDFEAAAIELQPAALDALLAARDEAQASGLEISPRGGAEAARRGYADTLRLWNTRVLPALDYWREHGRLSIEQIEHLRALPVREQVAAVLQWEAQEIFFSKDFSKTILQSVAAPGASQHLSMLAFDVAEFRDAAVRRILARHGWFQTVRSDLPHFTFLDLREEELPAHGLRRVEDEAQIFWTPDL
ncbi:MAG: hypothetical protein ABR577_10985 [Pyrinomonadaceae bacterium]